MQLQLFSKKKSCFTDASSNSSSASLLSLLPEQASSSLHLLQSCFAQLWFWNLRWILQKSISDVSKPPYFVTLFIARLNLSSKCLYFCIVLVVVPSHLAAFSRNQPNLLTTIIRRLYKFLSEHTGSDDHFITTNSQQTKHDWTKNNCDLGERVKRTKRRQEEGIKLFLRSGGQEQIFENLVE